MILRLRINNYNGRRDHETGGARLRRPPFDRKVEALILGITAPKVVLRDAAFV